MGPLSSIYATSSFHFPISLTYSSPFHITLYINMQTSSSKLDFSLLIVGPLSFHPYALPLPLMLHFPSTLYPHVLTFLSLPHAFPWRTHAFSLWKVEKSHVKVEASSIELEVTWMKAWVSSSCLFCPLLSLLSPHHFILFSISPHPKSLVSHWLIFSMSCLVPWIFDTCWRSKRGLLASQAI